MRCAQRHKDASQAGRHEPLNVLTLARRPNPARARAPPCLGLGDVAPRITAISHHCSITHQITASFSIPNH